MNEYTEKDVDQLVERVQQLVTDYHTLNVDVTKVKGDTESKLEMLTREFKHLSERIPEKLQETLIRATLTLETLVTNVKQIGIDMKADYVGRTEFEVLKTEHDQIKKLMWGFIAMVLTAVVGGVIALLFKG
jgi:hypothetical protein